MSKKGVGAYEGDPRDSAEYEYDQRNPMFRKEMKRLIERGVSRKLARPAARAYVTSRSVKLDLATSKEED